MVSDGDAVECCVTKWQVVYGVEEEWREAEVWVVCDGAECGKEQ